MAVVSPIQRDSLEVSRPVEVAAPESRAASRVGRPICPICACASCTPCFLAGPHKMYRCAECRTAFVDPMPSAEYLADFYSNYHIGTGDEGNYVNEDKMIAHHAAQLARVMKFTNAKPGRLLDLGCGKGFFLKECAARGIDCRGIELSNTAAEFARKELKLDVVQGLIRDRKAELGLYDTVTMWGVIEHLPDPVSVLKDAFDVLRPGGRIFVQTGIGDDWFDRLLPGVNQWYDPPQHLFVFSAPGLSRALKEAGFDTEGLDPAYDRSTKRRVARLIRNAVTGTLLRAASTIGRLHCGTFEMTKFPLAFDMSAVGRRR